MTAPEIDDLGAVETHVQRGTQLVPIAEVLAERLLNAGKAAVAATVDLGLARGFPGHGRGAGAPIRRVTPLDGRS